MSWIDKIKDKLIITTGDGKKYSPSWLNANFSREWNMTDFEFSELDGTLFVRKRPKGRRYPLELYFQGPDHLDTALAFDKSAVDPRPWTLEHPYYGFRTVQPISMQIDNSAHNVSKISVTVGETITEDAPKSQVDPVQQIKIKKALLDDSFSTALKAPLKAKDVNNMSHATKKNFQFAVPVLQVPDEFQKYTNLFNVANNAINNATQIPIAAMRSVISFINYPAEFSMNVKHRVTLVSNQFNTFNETITNNMTVGAKQVYQNLAASVISTMALASVNPLTGDYRNNKDVFSVIDLLIDSYNLYMSNLNNMQSDNGGNPLFFVPDATSLIQLSNLINLALSKLFSIAFSARMEKVFICDRDTNLILLTHRFYGLDPDDNNLLEMAENNNIGLNEVLQIQKGRKIIYYV